MPKSVLGFRPRFVLGFSAALFVLINYYWLLSFPPAASTAQQTAQAVKIQILSPRTVNLPIAPVGESPRSPLPQDRRGPTPSRAHERPNAPTNRTGDPTSDDPLTAQSGIMDPASSEERPSEVTSESTPASKSPAPFSNPSNDVVPAHLIEQVRPIYPPLAKAARVQGTVRFQATIDTTGRLTRLTLVSGPPLLVQPARDALQQWRYQPTLLNGEPVAVLTNIELNFTIDR